MILRLPRSGITAADGDLRLACREGEVACFLCHEGECNSSLPRIHKGAAV